jgi:hypothetical protein
VFIKSKHLKKANSNTNFAFIPLKINPNILQYIGFSYYALRLLVLGFKLIEFLKFNNEKPLKAIKEDLKPNLLIKKVFKINSNSNKI